MPTKTEQIGVIVLKDSEDNLVGIIYKDPKIKNKNIFYSCTEMSFDELERLFKKENNIIDHGHNVTRGLHSDGL